MPTLIDLCDSLLENLYDIASLNLRDLKDIRLQPSKVLELATNYLSKDQREFFDLVTSPPNQNKNVQLYMLSGLPGTGKSFLQSTINLYFQIQRKNVVSLAPTNLLAHQQKGKTIHSAISDSLCSKLEITKFKCQSDLLEKLIYSGYENISNMSLQQLCECIRKLIGKNDNDDDDDNNDNNLIILLDEGTMVCSILFSLLYFGYSKAKYIIMYGPNQLPPIVTVKEAGIIPSCDVTIAKENPDKVLFYELKTQKRFISEKNDNVLQDYVQYFSDVLSNKLVDQSISDTLNKMEYFLKHLRIGGNLRDYRNLKDSNKILLVNSNKQRCEENASRLAQEGEGPVYTIPTIKDPRLPKHYNIISRMGIDDELKIRKGVYCIIRVNNLKLGLIKGQMIKILDIILDNDDKRKIKEEEEEEEIKGCVKSLKVKLISSSSSSKTKINNNNNNGDDDDDDDKRNNILYLEKMDIPTDYYLIRGREDSVLMVRQFPITLSYSLTVHSAQGKTLDCNIGIDLIWNDVIPYFVCLSRVRKPSQLYVNEHPVYWLHRNMNIKNTNDVEKMRKLLMLDNNKKRIKDNDDDDDDILDKRVKSFKMSPEFQITKSSCNDINEIIKKICHQKTHQ